MACTSVDDNISRRPTSQYPAWVLSGKVPVTSLVAASFEAPKLEIGTAYPLNKPLPVDHCNMFFKTPITASIKKALI